MAFRSTPTVIFSIPALSYSRLSKWQENHGAVTPVSGWQAPADVDAWAVICCPYSCKGKESRLTRPGCTPAERRCRVVLGRWRVQDRRAWTGRHWRRHRCPLLGATACRWVPNQHLCCLLSSARVSASLHVPGEEQGRHGFSGDRSTYWESQVQASTAPGVTAGVLAVTPVYPLGYQHSFASSSLSKKSMHVFAVEEQLHSKFIYPMVTCSCISTSEVCFRWTLISSLWDLLFVINTSSQHSYWCSAEVGTCAW